MNISHKYKNRHGIFIFDKNIKHRNNEYDERNFNILLQMQKKHFWYVGRHKFILETLKKSISRLNFSTMDLGGGLGGWIEYLKEKIPSRISKIVLADSSRIALLKAKKVLSKYPDVKFYKVDIEKLKLKEKFDVITLLDVIEHCPDDNRIIQQSAKFLKSGGKLIITTPALKFFFSYNDILAKHLRRYNKKDFEALATNNNLILKDARYFMFLLSPLFYFYRKSYKNVTEKKRYIAFKKEHKIPHPILNFFLSEIFKLETLINKIFRFPFGTSIIGVFEKK
jgi:2-polyprenyl-3-methyl-5-hydroxy-6-metoxy-1,4-benzoquinol methylase